MRKTFPIFRCVSWAGFSLIEVVIALGIISFALVGILGLLPVGLNSQKQGAEQARAVQVLNDVTRAVRGVRSDGGTNRFLPPLSALQVGAGTTRGWNFLIDVIAQSGQVTPAGVFLPQGESRIWNSVAIDRFSAEILEQFTETIQE
jgi:type II secretory pathway pseudopilin PulG